jgi:hypothetical protein
VVQGSTGYEPKDGGVVQGSTGYEPKDGNLRKKYGIRTNHTSNKDRLEVLNTTYLVAGSIIILL